MLRIALLAAAASTAAAGTIDDGIADQKYLDYAEGFRPYTVKVEAVGGDGRTRVATATLIADHWALTAAHVVSCCQTVAILRGDERYEIDEVVIHADWDDVAGENDIALLHSGRPFGLDFYPPLATTAHNAGSVVSIAGYGITGPLSRGYDTSDGLLRAGTNRIERYERHMIICHASRGSSPLEMCIAPGDSGGPLFCGGELAGVNSLTMRDRGPLRSRDGEESGHTSVVRFVPWIRKVMDR